MLLELRQLSHLAYTIGEPTLPKGTMLIVCTMALAFGLAVVL
jgi:hypothetical protein